MEDRLRRIAHKLAVVPGLPGRGRAFGEQAHGFRLSPPLPEAEVAAFEAEHNVRLPDSYRAFLTTIGNGGPGRFGDAGTGPYYGLLPLRNWDYALVEEAIHEVLATPFPIDLGRTYGKDWLAEAGLDEDGEWFPGAVALCEQGCGYMGLLVVSGPARGRVVYTMDVERAPFFVSLDFLDWYEGWLDEIAAGIDSTWYGGLAAGDTGTLIGELRDAGRGDERRARVALTLGTRIDQPGVRLALRDAVSGDGPVGMRVAAVAVLAKHATPQDEPALLAALDDEEPRLRAVAWRPGDR